MPLVTDRWYKFASQDSITQRREVAWIGSQRPCSMTFSFKHLETQRKPTKSWPLGFPTVVPLQAFFSLSAFPSLNLYPPVFPPSRTTRSWPPCREIQGVCFGVRSPGFKATSKPYNVTQVLWVLFSSCNSWLKELLRFTDIPQVVNSQFDNYFHYYYFCVGEMNR